MYLNVIKRGEHAKFFILKSSPIRCKNRSAPPSGPIRVRPGALGDGSPPTSEYLYNFPRSFIQFQFGNYARDKNSI